MTQAPGRSYLWMISSALSFSTMGVLTKILAESFDWRFLAMVRALLMLVFAGVIGLLARSTLTLRGTPIMWMRSLVGSLSMVCTYYTLIHLPFSEATTLIKSYPLWVAILSWIVLKERPSGKVWIAILIGLVGIVLVAQPHFAEARIALAVGVLSSLCTAVVMLGLNRLAHVDSKVIVVHFALCATVTCAGVFLFSGKSAPIPDLKHAGFLLAMGVTGTFGQIALTRAFALGDPSRVSVVGLVEIIFALTYDRLLWHRSFNAVALVGMALVAAPTAWLLATTRRARPGANGSPEPDVAATAP
jgi:drug/metabolite transporter (DMT)-like permease